MSGFVRMGLGLSRRGFVCRFRERDDQNMGRASDIGVEVRRRIVEVVGLSALLNVRCGI
jgi:hypothetical protein